MRSPTLPRQPSPRLATPAPRGQGPEADLRLAVPALATWAATAVVVQLPPGPVLLAVPFLAAAGVIAAYLRAVLVALVLVLVAGACLAGSIRVDAVASSPVADLADVHAVAHLRMEVTSDPRVVHAAHESTVVFDADVHELRARGKHAVVDTPVVVWADASARRYRLGEVVTAVATLNRAQDSQHAASLDVHRSARSSKERAWWWAAAGRVRAAVTGSVSERPPDVRALVPALVHGDDHALTEELAEDFRDTGLTHLLAVSGTNLTLVVGSVLVLARATGVGIRSQVVLGALGTAAFVVLARPEPSVVRAAAMGLVALLGLGSGGRGRGVRCLAWAVIALVYLDPWLARSVGFCLSTLATAGILVLGPPWRDALSRWMPRWCAEALAVPMTAQLACTPVVAAISGNVSLVAVVANLLAGPAVAPATVLGIVGGLAGLVSSTAAHVAGLGSGLSARWIIEVARHGAALPGATYEWGSGALAVSALAGVCLLVAFGGAHLLHRPVVCIGVGALTAVVVVHPLTPGWPPAGWVMVACNVGQGDATVLNAGKGRAVVVDTGPEPRPVDRCLGDLGVSAVPVVVLTHGHADHVGGLAGVMRGRRVGELDVGPGGGPSVRGVPRHVVEYGESRRVGQVAWTVIGPPPGTKPPEGVDGSAANDVSVVLLATVRGVRILLTGDIEPQAQAALLRARPDLHADILKVPHHGSARQDPELFEELGARYGTLSAGVGNPFGHPAPRTVELMRAEGITPLRTDRRGDVALTVEDGRLRAVTR